jgi:hypothetical protein
MKVIPLITMLLLSLALTVDAMPDNATNGGEAQKYLSVTPDLDKATLDEGRVTIPFLVKNTSSYDVVLENGSIQLMTLTEAGSNVDIEEYRSESSLYGFGGPKMVMVTLKGGMTRTLEGRCAMETLAFVAAKNQKVFAELDGRVAIFNQLFRSESNPFTIPPELTKPPWVDLGKQNYLLVTVDGAKPSIQTSGGGSRRCAIPGINYWGYLMFPIKITNVTTQTFIVNSVHVSFCKANDSKAGPDLWELVRDLKPGPEPDEWADKESILKPGASIMAGGRSYIILWNNPAEIGWKEGDQMVVAVGGRIPNTNKVFESYSAPFCFPHIQ